MRRWPLLAVLALPGCALWEPTPRPIALNYYLGDARDLMLVRRVVVLPFAGPDVPDAQLEQLRKSLAEELAVTHRFQVVPLPLEADEDRELYTSEERGRISSRALVEVGKRYQVDGVVFARVTSFRPYLPPVLGLQVQLVSVHSGEVVWMVDEMFDAGREEIRLDLLDYKRRNLAPETSLHDWEMILLSPRRFSGYVTARVVSTLLTPATP